MFRRIGGLRRAALVVAAAFGALVAASPTHAQGQARAAIPAQQDRHSYDVSLRGITAAAVTLEGSLSRGSYQAKAVIETTGLGAAIRRVRFVGESQGALQNGRFRPARYAEDADTGKRQSVSVIEYARGVPRVVTYRSNRDHRLKTVDPATQGDTLDPITSLYAILRDTPRAKACTARVTTFDGRRRSETRLLAARADGERLVCAGEYRRIAGFTPEELAERTRFPFALTYAPIEGGLMRVVEVSLDTLYGKAVMKRR